MNAGDWIIRIWNELSVLSPSELTNIVGQSGMLPSEVLSSLEAIAVSGTVNINSEALLSSQGNAGKFRLLQLLDEHFLTIHPRAKKVSLKRIAGKWLAEYEKTRENDAHYACFENHRLIAHGPLSLSQRNHYESGGELLADHFSAFRVVSRDYKHENRVIHVVHNVLSNNGFRGVESKGDVPASKVSFFPLADSVKEYLVQVEKINTKHFVTLTPEFSVADRLKKALKNLHQSDIGIAPEFSVPQNCVDDVVEVCKASEKMPRLFLIGTGITDETDPDCGMPWNEARVINSAGTRLWNQRKLWPSQIPKRRCSDYGLDPSVPNAHEKNASGSELKIVDIDNFGRCLILICQDIVATPLANEVIRSFQPDWVLVPIIDVNKFEGRWLHAALLNHASTSRSRYVGCSSGVNHDSESGSFEVGLCVGPSAQSPNEITTRRVAIVTASNSTDAITIDWSASSDEDKRWTKSNLTQI